MMSFFMINLVTPNLSFSVILSIIHCTFEDAMTAISLVEMIERMPVDYAPGFGMSVPCQVEI